MHWWIYVFFPVVVQQPPAFLTTRAAAITNLDVKGHHHTTPDSIHEQHKATCIILYTLNRTKKTWDIVNLPKL